MGRISKIDKRVLAFVIPAILGVVAGLVTVSSDLLAYLEGPLPVVLLSAGLLVGLVAAAVVSVLSPRPVEEAPEPQSESGTVARLAMLTRLHDVITGRLEAIDQHLDRVDGGDDALSEARREMERLERFLFDMHGVASMHDVTPDLAEIDPTELVHSVIDRTAKVTGHRTVKADLPTHAAPLLADRRLLTLAIANLIVNAVKFSIPESPIVVRVVDHPERVVFEVDDQGPGVPEGEDVWGELTRGSNAEGLPGAGLGLPLVRLIAEAHGGSAHLDSSPSGTLAAIEVPRT